MRENEFSIQSNDQAQLNAIPQGLRAAVIRYVSRPPHVLVQTATLQERPKFPILGISKISLQIEAVYPNDALPGALSQLRYELVGYKDNAGAVVISTGVCSPFYDRVPDEFWINFDNLALRFATPNTGTAIARPIIAKYSILGYE